MARQGTRPWAMCASCNVTVTRPSRRLLPVSESARGRETSRQKQNDRRELIMAWLHRIHSALVWALLRLLPARSAGWHVPRPAGADAVLQCREYLCFAYHHGTILSSRSDRSLHTVVVPFGPFVLSFAKMESASKSDQVGLTTPCKSGNKRTITC